MNISKENSIVILSMKMAAYLMWKGNPLVDLKDDLKMSGRKIFIFEKTTKLTNDLGGFANFKDLNS
jgi:hypothetical protein